MDGRDGFVVTKYTKVCHEHLAPEDLLRVPGGKRWRLKNADVPLKVGRTDSVAYKRKPPPVKHEAVKRVKVAWSMEVSINQNP